MQSHRRKSMPMAPDGTSAQVQRGRRTLAHLGLRRAQLTKTHTNTLIDLLITARYRRARKPSVDMEHRKPRKQQQHAVFPRIYDQLNDAMQVIEIIQSPSIQSVRVFLTLYIYYKSATIIYIYSSERALYILVGTHFTCKRATEDMGLVYELIIYYIVYYIDFNVYRRSHAIKRI